jgi:hypothetical protein
MTRTAFLNAEAAIAAFGPFGSHITSNAAQEFITFDCVNPHLRGVQTNHHTTHS